MKPRTGHVSNLTQTNIGGEKVEASWFSKFVLILGFAFISWCIAVGAWWTVGRVVEVLR